MQTNPLLLFFLVLSVAFTVAVVVLAILQRRMLADQSRAVREMLQEARELAQRGELDLGDGQEGELSRSVIEDEDDA